MSSSSSLPNIAVDDKPELKTPAKSPENRDFAIDAYPYFIILLSAFLYSIFCYSGVYPLDTLY